MLEELYCTYDRNDSVWRKLILFRTSPTAYNVFTGTASASCQKTTLADESIAYSVTSAYTSNGLCVTTSGSPIQVSPAYSQTLTSANGRVTLDVNGQQSFIDHLGFSTCSGGGENVIATALVQVQNTTMTTTSSFTNVPLAAAVASLTIAPVSPLNRKGRYLVPDVLFCPMESVSKCFEPIVFLNKNHLR